MQFLKSLDLRVRSAGIAAVLICLLGTASYAGVHPSSHDLTFGKITVGSQSEPATITLTNDGPGEIEIKGVSLSSLEFVYSGPELPVTLKAGQRLSGTVTFVPTGVDKYTARLTFVHEHGATTEVELSGTGVSGTSGLVVRPVVTPAITPAITPDPVTPTITWPTPTAITYGTALSGAQLDATASTAGSFVYSPAAGTVLSAGSQTLLVTFTPTDTTDFTTATASVTLTVNTVTKTTPTITWPAPSAITYGTALGGAQLDATASTAGSFVYSPAAGTTLGAGSQTLSVTFTPSNTTNFNAATGSVALTVNKATPTITWPAPAAISSGTALSAGQLDATASTPGSFVYSPVSGTVLSAGSQTLSVTFTPSDTTDYNTATSRVTLTVNTVTKTTPTITWPTPAGITYGTALSGTQLDATASTAGSFAYSPAAGTTLGAGSQTLSVTFTPSNTTNFNSATGSVTLTVSKATPTISWPAPAAITSGTALSAAQLDATASTPGSFAYSPAPGTVLSAGGQTLSVTFTPSDTTDYNTATGSVGLTVNAAPKTTPTITWPTPAGITYGTALSGAQLDATASTAGSFAYSPAAGTTLGAGSQTLSVTFTPTDTTDFNNATGSVALTVSKATPTINWPTPAAITSGTALSATQLDATASTAGSFAYSPSAGTTPGAGSQTLSVTFTPTDTTDFNTATSSVGLTVNAAPKTTPTITWPTPTAITYGTTLSATQLDATASTAGSFAYSPAAGTTPGAGSQTLSVTFTPTDTTDFNTATSSVTLTVNKATPTINWPTPAAITSGAALSASQLDATSNTPGSFVYSPVSGTVVSAGSQTLSTTFTPTDTTDYNTATSSVTLTVNAAPKTTPTITWPTPTGITYGTALSGAQLDATASTAGSFVYSPAAGTTLGAGSQTLSVTFTPSNTTNFNSATGSVTLTVNKATPTISWPTPAAIASGTALSAAQLDASSNTAGSFAYSPAPGAVLSAGSQTLSVTFTPSDTTDYNTVTGSVGLTVNNAPPATGTLTANPTSVSFGSINVGSSSSSQTVTLGNSGAASVTISNLSISTPGVTLSGVPTGTVLNPGQSVNLGLIFAPSSAGVVGGGVTITSNASNSSMTIPLSATGVSAPASYSVSLSWASDSSASGGYDVYSSTTSGGPYNLLTSTPVMTTSYTDTTVQPNTTYYYVVTAVQSGTNMQSGYSSQVTAVVP